MPQKSILPILLFLSLVTTACGPKTTRMTIHEDPSITLILRGKTKGGEPIDRGYVHPMTISGTRIAHILSRIDVRPKPKGKAAERQPALPISQIYDLGDALSVALAKANESQEIVGFVTDKRRVAGIFAEKRLTSFIAYHKGDSLHFHFYRVDWKVDEDEKDPFEPQIESEPLMQFNLIGSEGMVITARNSVAVDWRSDVFRSPQRLRVTGTGKVLRREILLQSQEETDDGDPSVMLPEVGGQLSGATLRKLADLEDARRAGKLTEIEYQNQRRKVLLENSDNP